jgi:REP element-mobilizing transposase RayT
VNDKKLKLNAAGRMITKVFVNLPKYYNKLIIDTYIVMPDHFHAIIFLDHYVGASLCGRPQLKNYIWSQHNTVCARSNLALGEIIGRFKSYTTTQYIAGVRNDNWKPFYEKLWQRGFYDRVVRNRGELFVIRKYICNNPLKKKS